MAWQVPEWHYYVYVVFFILLAFAAGRATASNLGYSECQTRLVFNESDNSTFTESFCAPPFPALNLTVFLNNASRNWSWAEANVSVIAENFTVIVTQNVTNTTGFYDYNYTEFITANASIQVRHFNESDIHIFVMPAPNNTVYVNQSVEVDVPSCNLAFVDKYLAFGENFSLNNVTCRAPLANVCGESANASYCGNAIIIERVVEIPRPSCTFDDLNVSLKAEFEGLRVKAATLEACPLNQGNASNCSVNLQIGGQTRCLDSLEAYCAFQVQTELANTNNSLASVQGELQRTKDALDGVKSGSEAFNNATVAILVIGVALALANRPETVVAAGRFLHRSFKQLPPDDYAPPKGEAKK